MPLTELDPNVSGRTSRASNMSAGSRGFSKSHASKTEGFSAPAAVMSMLKTSTELGDLGFGQSRIPARQRPVHRMSGHASRLSMSSNNSQPINQLSNHHAWPSVSSARRSITSSLNVPQFLPDTMSPTLLNLQGTSPLIPPAHLPKSGRSFSLTQASQPTYMLSSHRSYASLRGQEPPLRPRSPYRYPTRLKRPGYRPSSPAMSDITGIQPRRLHVSGLGPMGPGAPRLRAPPPSQFIPEGNYNLPYQPGRNRSAPSVAPAVPDNYVHLPFQQPGLNKSAPALKTVPSSESHSSRDSDLPSSEPAPPSSPQTPIASAPLEVIVGPHAAEATVTTLDDTLKVELSNSPIYYDYTEHFENNDFSVTPRAVPLGFVNRIRTILEERVNGDVTPPPTATTIPVEIAELPGSEPVELPATPVVKRITREMVLAAIVSSDQTAEDSQTMSLELHTSSNTVDDSTDSGSVTEEPIVPSSAATDKHSSGLSDLTISGNSNIDSSDSVIDIAVKYSLPLSMCSTDSAKIEVADEDVVPEERAASPPPVVVVEATTKLEDAFEVAAVSERPKLPKVRAQSAVSPTLDRMDSLRHSSATSPGRRAVSEAGRSQAGSDFTIRFSIPQTADSRPREDTQIQEDEAATPPGTATVLETRRRSFTPCPSLASVSPLAAHVPSTEAPIPPLSTVAHADTPSSRDSFTTTHLVWPMRKSSVSPPTPKESQALVCPTAENTTADRRLSGARYTASNLSDVREEPQEESSQPDLRSSSFKFPASRASLRRSLEDIPLFKRASVRSIRSTFRKSSLSETKLIPSMNFSRMDLFAKLNEAFELRSARSLDGVPGDLMVDTPFPQERPLSAGAIREKYKSFFATLEELERPVAEEIINKPSLDLIPTSRPFSPDELITEVNRLSIPDVNALTQRLSELLPSLKRYLPEEEEGEPEDEALSTTLTEIRDLGKRHSLSNQRSSVRLRPMPGRASLVVVEDNVYEEMTQQEGSKPHLVEEVPSSESGEDTAAEKAVKEVEAQETPPVELEAPVPAHLRARSMSTGTAEGRRLTARESRLLRRSERSLRSLRSVSTAPRPWNLDTSYPWASSVPEIDISLPSPVLLRDSPKLGPSKLRLRMSGSSGASDANSPEHIERMGSPNAVKEGTKTDDSIKHSRRSSKKSILRSLSHRITQLHGPFDSSGYPNGPDQILNLEERTVDPGDRYPTTGLTPPSAFNLEEVRSFFSDDSSQTQRGGSFRKRLTHLKARLPPVRAHSAMESRSIDKGDGVQSRDSRIGAGGSVRTFDGTVGMSKMEFRAKRVFEKIKTLWFKSGELIRSFSIRRKNHRETQDWLADSDVYSGT